MDIRKNKSLAQMLLKPMIHCSVVFMFFIILLTFLQVCLRYMFSHSFAWIEEVSRYLFVWIVFLGAAIAFDDDSHIKIDFIENKLPKKIKGIVQYFIVLLNLLAMALLLYSGTLVAMRNRKSMFYTIPDVSLLTMYIAVFLSCVLAIILIVLRIKRNIGSDKIGRAQV